MPKCVPVFLPTLQVVYLETEGDHDLVVLNPRWLGTDVIGQLLSHEKILQSRPTGCFTVDDIQLMYLEVEAPCLLQILEALEICSHCDIDGEVEYEFPCFNFVETLNGLWEKNSLRYQGAVYGGLRIGTQRGVENQLMPLFPRIQVQLRRSTLQDNNNPENDLYQWHYGSKFCWGNMESLITLEENDQLIEVKARGPEDCRTQLYYFLEDICNIVDQVITDSCPGLCTERQILSATHLRGHKAAPEVPAYSSRDLLNAQLKNSTKVTLEDGLKENLFDLGCFGSDDIKSMITLGVELHISHLSIYTRRHLSLLLDVSDPMGRDWCMLAVLLGLSQNLPQLDETKTHLEN